MPGAPRHRGNYPKGRLEEAIRMVQDGQMTSIKASEVYKVPQGTIRSHTSNPSLKIGAGRMSYLNGEEESRLVELIKSLVQTGIRLTKWVLKKVVGQYLRLVTRDDRLKSKPSDQTSEILLCLFTR